MIRCPVCKMQASELDMVSLAAGFHCREHGPFRVSHDVLAAPALVGRPRGDWEAALRKAKASAQPAEFALCITVYHF